MVSLAEEETAALLDAVDAELPELAAVSESPEPPDKAAILSA